MLHLSGSFYNNLMNKFNKCFTNKDHTINEIWLIDSNGNKVCEIEAAWR